MNAPMVPESDMIDGAGLLDELHAAVTDYVILPDAHAADAVTLWIAATHCLSAFDHATRLVVKSPEKRCGKSRLLEIIADTCRNPLVTVNCTEAALFRSIGDDPPTLLLDEADAMFGSKVKAEQNEGLRGLLNAGYRRGLTTLRTMGPQHTPTGFPTFAMAALAAIGSVPDTIEDRAVIVTMRRRAPGEQVHPYRFRRDRPRLVDLAQRLAGWAEGLLDDLAHVETALPLEDRAADCWEPLVAVADAAGGHWPQRARAAASVMAAEADNADSEHSLGVRLLADVRTVLGGQSFMGSHELLTGLRKLDESPWRDYDLTVRKLAQRLKRYGVHPTTDPTKKTRGYKVEHLADPFTRYLPSPSVQASGDAMNATADRQNTSVPQVSGKCPAGPGDASRTLLDPQSAVTDSAHADAWTLTDTSGRENEHQAKAGYLTGLNDEHLAFLLRNADEPTVQLIDDELKRRDQEGGDAA